MHLMDDATSTAQFSFSKEETTWAAANLLRAWIERYGGPKALYPDWKSVYVSEPTEKQRLRGEEPVSQFGRMCARLGIRIIAAGSPQAKGRVERAHGTHQDRLVKKLRLAGVASYEEANRFLLAGYLADHNRRFRRDPTSEADFHRKRPTKAELDALFCLEQERVLSLDWVVSYQGRLLQLERQSRHHVPAKSKVLLRENQQGQIHIEYRGCRLGFTEIEQRPTRHPSQKPSLAAKLQADANPSGSILKAITTGTFLSRKIRGHFYCDTRCKMILQFILHDAKLHEYVGISLSARF
jgi:hypothetical protein